MTDKTYTVIVEEPAYYDLRNIFLYIANDSQLIAEQVQKDLLAQMKTLQNFPESHSVVLVVRNYEIRHLVFKKGFRILYTIKDNEVHILHCFRCEQNLSDDLF